MEYEKVIIESSRSIYRYLLKIGVTPAEAEDIVQDTIHKVTWSRKTGTLNRLRNGF
ncbi:RNA polymerase subunit sigma-70 [Bacillus sp. FSL R12-0069]|uniref:RNA polymerase subunit sigma-70 n=1 Tax=Bacillus sp. FSL R12-0069 TaxID=2975342 RepID=UPI0030F71AAC